MIVTQARDFNAYRSRLAASVAAAPPVKETAAKQQDQGKISAKVPPAIVAAEKVLENQIRTGKVKGIPTTV